MKQRMSFIVDTTYEADGLSKINKETKDAVAVMEALLIAMFLNETFGNDPAGNGVSLNFSIDDAEHLED